MKKKRKRHDEDSPIKLETHVSLVEKKATAMEVTRSSEIVILSDTEDEEASDKTNKEISLNKKKATAREVTQSNKILILSDTVDKDASNKINSKLQQNQKSKKKGLEISRTKQFNNRHSTEQLLSYKHPLLVTYGITSKDLDREGVRYQKGHWTEHETQILKNNIEKFLKDNNIKSFFNFYQNMKETRSSSKVDGLSMYITLGEHIHRPLEFIRRKVDDYVNEEFGQRKAKYKRFSDEENKLLLKLYLKYPDQWTKIGSLMDRNSSTIQARYKTITKKSQYSTENRRFNSQDDKKIIDFVSAHGKNKVINWTKIDTLLSRRPGACKDRWKRVLCNKSSSSRQKGAKRVIESYDTYLVITKALVGAEVKNTLDIDWDNLFQQIKIPKSMKLIGNFQTFYAKYAGELKGKTYCDKLKSFIDLLETFKQKRKK